MKTKISVAAMAFGMFAFALVSTPAKLAVASSESGEWCNWKRIYCSKWGSGSYEVCISGGDGRSCSCGKIDGACYEPDTHHL